MADLPPLLLLDGKAALDLAPRLMASGYRTTQLPTMQEPIRSESAAPAAVILSPGLQEQIPLLRRRWGSLPILLGCPDDNVEGRCLALSNGA
ncbi:MAG: DNA-binding response regulator, partial [Cyanobacteriota bacterium]